MQYNFKVTKDENIQRRNYNVILLFVIGNESSGVYTFILDIHPLTTEKY